MHLDAEMRGFLLIQDQLNRLIEFRDRKHRPRGQGDPVDRLRGALVADLSGPLELGDLKFQRVDLALAWLRLGRGGGWSWRRRVDGSTGIENVTRSRRGRVVSTGCRRSNSHARCTRNSFAAHVGVKAVSLIGPSPASAGGPGRCARSGHSEFRSGFQRDSPSWRPRAARARRDVSRGRRQTRASLEWPGPAHRASVRRPVETSGVGSLADETPRWNSFAGPRPWNATLRAVVPARGSALRTDVFAECHRGIPFSVPDRCGRVQTRHAPNQPCAPRGSGAGACTTRGFTGWANVSDKASPSSGLASPRFAIDSLLARTRRSCVLR